MNIHARVHALASAKPTQLRIEEKENHIIIDDIHQEKNKRETFIFDKITTTSIKCTNKESPYMCFRDNYRWMIINSINTLVLKNLFNFSILNLIECEDILIITEDNKPNNIVVKCDILENSRQCSSTTPCYYNRKRTIRLKPFDVRRPVHII